MKTFLEDSQYTPSFSGHETFPLRQMWLKKVFNQKTLENTVDKSVFSDESAISRFGVGKNMVASIRHWAIACRVLDDPKDTRTPFSITHFGNTIFADDGLDPFSEDPSTAWFVHWCLAGEAHRATTWFWLFNRITTPTFSKSDLISPITQFAHYKKIKLSASTLIRDIETCIRSYIPNTNTGSIEDFSEPMLGELALLEEVSKGVFSFRRGPKITLSNGIFAFALIRYWQRVAPMESTLSFETIAYGDGSPGRVFKMDEDSVAERLFSLSKITDGGIIWDDTAGLRQVIRKPFDSKLLELELLKNAYV